MVSAGLIRQNIQKFYFPNSFGAEEEEGSLVRGEATGSFSFLGVTKEITVPVSFNYLEDAANKRAGKKKPGDKRDLLVL